MRTLQKRGFCEETLGERGVVERWPLELEYVETVEKSDREVFDDLKT